MSCSTTAYCPRYLVCGPLTDGNARGPIPPHVFTCPDRAAFAASRFDDRSGQPGSHKVIAGEGNRYGWRSTEAA